MVSVVARVEAAAKAAEAVVEKPAAQPAAAQPQAASPETGVAKAAGQSLARPPEQGTVTEVVNPPRPAVKIPPKARPLDMFASYTPGPTASPARMRARHWGLVILFAAMVILPAMVYGAYLYAYAADQYESNVGFGSRTQDAPSTFAFLGALGGAGASSSKDMDILNQFMTSQELVSRVDKKLNLRAIYSKPQNDPVFAFPKDGPIEDLVDYWQQMVIANYDSGTGLMKLRVYAFDPVDAQKIAQAVLEESTAIINELSRTAQADTSRFAQQTLKSAEERLAKAQKALTDFRVKNHIVDPQMQLQGASAVVNSLVQAMGAAEIELDMLQGTVPQSDPRIAQLNRRIEVIQKRMDAENAKVGVISDTNSPGYAQLMVDYQNLLMEQEFSQKAYLTSLSAYDQTLADAQHKTRYLTTYLSPTLAESSTSPNRLLRIALTLLAGFLSWASVVMIYYALRDRR